MRRAGQDRSKRGHWKALSKLEVTITDRLATLERLAAIMTDVDATYQEKQGQLAAAATEGEVTIHKKGASSAPLPKDQLLRIRAVAAQIRDELTAPGNKPT